MKVFLGGNLFHFHEAQIELVHLSVWLQAFYIQYLYTPLLISHHFASNEHGKFTEKPPTL